MYMYVGKYVYVYICVFVLCPFKVEISLSFLLVCFSDLPISLWGKSNQMISMIFKDLIFKDLITP